MHCCAPRTVKKWSANKMTERQLSSLYSVWVITDILNGKAIRNMVRGTIRPSILLDNHIWGLFQPDRTRTVKPTLMWLVWVCFICTLMKSWAVSYLLNNRIDTKAPAEQEEKWLNKLTSQIYSCKMNYMMIINNKYAAKIRNNLWCRTCFPLLTKCDGSKVRNSGICNNICKILLLKGGAWTLHFCRMFHSVRSSPLESTEVKTGHQCLSFISSLLCTDTSDFIIPRPQQSKYADMNSHEQLQDLKMREIM